ncbi:Protein of unknown function [Pyronema omphalodes CBS 100304]|uniref:Uncharacterized protein n=1 Tax=Pyronema omphalodes (strain CBS 100304) TaxID=1076935 RepID=U4L591_PYROM|nr:Protein of unknown function [Pyronema omphalodes CBS 100304]
MIRGERRSLALRTEFPHPKHLESIFNDCGYTILTTELISLCCSMTKFRLRVAVRLATDWGRGDG